MPHWAVLALLAMVFIMPAFHLTGIAYKNFSIMPVDTAILWIGGSGLGMLMWRIFFVETPTGSHTFGLQTVMHVIILGMALTIGAAGNIFLFESLAHAPNPGYPPAIVNANAILAIPVGLLLAMFIPGIPEWSFSWIKMTGVVLAVVGITLLMWE